MPANDQYAADCETLAMISAGLDRLEANWEDSRKLVQAGSRGYFTPDEDDAVRQMLLSYRNYRIGLYEIIHRCTGYGGIADPAVQLKTFLVGFAAGLTLYSKSLKLIHAYEREPLVRAKLNEPEEKFGLAGGFFEEVLAAYSSPRNYWLLLKASAFWGRNQRRVKRMGLLEENHGKWMAGMIRRQRKAIPRRLLKVLGQRLRYDLRLFWDTTLNPLRRTGYHLKSVVGTAFAGARVTLHYTPALTPAILGELKGKLRPGDILLVRADEKLTATLLPGFWSHAAIYLGTRGDFEEAGLEMSAQRAAVFERAGEGVAMVIEAIAPKLTVSSLEKSLFGDHVVVLRPEVPVELLEVALREAFAHLGKPYDFEFDFNVTNRMVCTELVYRAFHKKGGIEFQLVKRLGRFTLTGNDIVHYALDGLRAGNASLRPVVLVLKRGGKGVFVEEGDIVTALEGIRAGKTPDALALGSKSLLETAV